MPKFKIIGEYPGYEIGQIVEFNSPFRIAQMNGDGVNPTKGVRVLDELKKGVSENENSTNRTVDGKIKRGTIRPKRINGPSIAVKKGSGKTKAKKISR